MVWCSSVAAWVPGRVLIFPLLDCVCLEFETILRLGEDSSGVGYEDAFWRVGLSICFIGQYLSKQGS